MEQAEEQDVDMASAADINGDDAAAPVYFSLSSSSKFFFRFLLLF